MQLISLSSNKESFKTVRFNNSVGLNFILATQKNPELTDQKGKTYNGVGKSLIIAIIHFCLGSNNKEDFRTKLPGWKFILEFRIGDKHYISERSTENQSKIKLDGREITLKEFNQTMGALLFKIPEQTEHLTFRSLLAFFLRPRKASYTSFNNPNAINNEYQIQIINALLLGLDVKMAEEKYLLRKKEERIKNLIKELGNDPILRDFFIGNKDVSLAQSELDENIAKITQNIESFKVAEDYYEISAQADKIKANLDQLQNQKILLTNQLQNIDNTLVIKPDIKRESIETIYKEASVVLNDGALKTLDELHNFYEHLSSNRERRLLEQKNDLQRKLNDVTAEIKIQEQELDSNLKYLNAHQALDIFVQMTHKLTDLRFKRDEIKRFDALMSMYKNEKLEIDRKLLESTKRTDEYLTNFKEKVSTATNFFRELSKRFYPKAAAGITIYNNERDNQIRFNIDAKIEADSSDGINNIKIFCYDLTLLLKGYSHRVNFLFHDSRVLSDIDPRQTAEIFRILNEYIVKSKKQYVLSMNQNQLDELKKHLTKDEIENIIEKNVCLELKDESHADKLLGIQVDLDYS
ncbi:MAG: DUF2326 domain-containing protein [Ignavibacteriaceae bacterium]|nr:MAG: DUF2326 domain-containing protein [Ignavibacteriaceae bacterium]MBV6445971.1 hypothetical protein [Ignavibacteriaceae bacterium]MBZ0196115.1 DUF2326 domain-containing protein [Ignavibacteriaceae bacterium]OQY80113.1 MAG: hypothetical protein B6D45_00015 [Ignavibacteriales bacterium UTCHB3]